MLIRTLSSGTTVGASGCRTTQTELQLLLFHTYIYKTSKLFEQSVDITSN